MRQAALDAGAKPDFLPETEHIREAEWTVAPLPADLLDRRVEITGPVDRKMIINALNSGAKVFMADFEDSTTPTWDNLLDGQLNLVDAIRRTITYDDPTTKKSYKLIENPAVLFVRARGWHLDERHMLVDGEPMSGSLFDFGLYAFHNAKELLARGSGPYFYLPKMESHLEARLWNDVFVQAEAELGIPKNSIKGTVLIETILASFEMDEILYELRDHSAGLNCGRWDYIFSFIKKFAGDISRPAARPRPGHHDHALHAQLFQALPSRPATAATSAPWAACPRSFPSSPIPSPTRRPSPAFAPTKSARPPTATTAPGSRIPASSPSRSKSSTASCRSPTRSAKQLPDYHTTAADLLQVPAGTITEAGLKQNVAVGLGYVEAWLRGIGCVPLFNLMEDAATAEISRAQLWQWVHHGAKITDGANARHSHHRLRWSSRPSPTNSPRRAPKVDDARFSAYQRAADPDAQADRSSPTFPEFLTVPAYAEVLAAEKF